MIFLITMAVCFVMLAIGSVVLIRLKDWPSAIVALGASVVVAFVGTLYAFGVQ